MPKPEFGYRKLKDVVEALTYLTDLVANQEITIHDLRELLFPATAKTEAVLKKVGMEGMSKAASDPPGTRQTGEQKQNAGATDGTELKLIATRAESGFHMRA